MDLKNPKTRKIMFNHLEKINKKFKRTIECQFNKFHIRES